MPMDASHILLERERNRGAMPIIPRSHIWDKKTQSYCMGCGIFRETGEDEVCNYEVSLSRPLHVAEGGQAPSQIL